MAIDYKVEWKKFQATHGNCYLVSDPGSCIVPTHTLANAMKTWIRNVILNREGLMKEYIKENMTTDIGKVNDDVYNVKLYLYGCPNGTISVGRLNFDEWCKRKEKKHEKR